MGFTQRHDAPNPRRPIVLGVGGLEGGVVRDVRAVRPGLPRPRRDSLSLELSSSDRNERGILDGEKSKEDLAREFDWAELQSGARRVTVGGTDAAEQLHGVDGSDNKQITSAP